MDTTVELGDVILGRTRGGVLALLLGRPDEEFHVRHVARLTGRTIGPVQKELKKRYRNQVPLSVVADHIQHIAQVAGIDHVCLGSDYDGIPFAPVGLDDATKLPNLTAELLRRGMSEADVRKVLGENLLRILELR